MQEKLYNFFLDIDGTMLPHGKNELSSELKNALVFAKEKGCKIFVNTGRTPVFIPYAIRTSELFDGFCCGCGTYVEYRNKIISENYIGRSELTELARLFEPFAAYGDILFEGLERMYYLSDCAPWAEKQGFIKLPDAEYFMHTEFAPKVQKFSVHLPEEHRPEFISLAKKYYHVMTFPSYIEIVPHGFDKGKAIEITENLLRLDKNKTVAIGDSDNDKEMLLYAPTSVAMGNSPDSIKNICTLTTDTCENDGLAKIIYRLLK